MTCAELEILLADYLDGAVSGVEKSAVEAHLAGCASCVQLARDAAGAVAFMERTATVEPPPGMIARILLDTRIVVRRSWGQRWLGFVSQFAWRLVRPVWLSVGR